MTATTTITDYYAALRKGDPLYPFFHPEETLMKFGISETLTGYADVKAGLQDQTATTTDWRVTSHDLRVTEQSGCAWFSDHVTLEWRNTDTTTDHSFETRWSGTLKRTDEDWQFVIMHVSTPRQISP